MLGKLPVPGRPTIWILLGQESIALAVGAGGGCLDIFTLIYPFFPLFPCLWKTARYRLKYCLKGPLNPKQPTNQRCTANTAQTEHFHGTAGDSFEILISAHLGGGTDTENRPSGKNSSKG